MNVFLHGLCMYLYLQFYIAGKVNKNKVLGSKPHEDDMKYISQKKKKTKTTIRIILKHTQDL